jgi:hypothetical protein
MEIFQIKKGKHRSGYRFKPYLGFRKVFFVKVNFLSSCIAMREEHDKFDTNKLYGVSFGRHHKNSVRIGWRVSEGKIEVCLYTYHNGVRSIHWCKEKLDIDTEYRMVLHFKKDKCNLWYTNDKLEFFSLNTIDYKLPKWRIGYYLWPYFGGDTTAPNNMIIMMQHE